MWKAAGRGWDPALIIMWQAAEAASLQLGAKHAYVEGGRTRLGSNANHHVAGSRSSEYFGWEPGMCMWQAAGSGWEPAQISPREAEHNQMSRELLRAVNRGTISKTWEQSRLEDIVIRKTKQVSASKFFY